LINSKDELLNCKYRKFEPSITTLPNIIYFLRVKQYKENEVRLWFISTLTSFVVDIFGDKEKLNEFETSDIFSKYQDELKNTFSEIFISEIVIQKIDDYITNIYNRYITSKNLHNKKDFLDTDITINNLSKENNQSSRFVKDYSKYIFENKVKKEYENLKELYTKNEIDNQRILSEISKRLKHYERLTELYEENSQIVKFLNKIPFNQHLDFILNDFEIKDFDKDKTISIFSGFFEYVFKYYKKSESLDFPNIDLTTFLNSINRIKSSLLKNEKDLEDERIKLIKSFLKKYKNTNDNYILLSYRLSDGKEIHLTLDYLKLILIDNLLFTKLKELLELNDNKKIQIEDIDDLLSKIQENKNSKFIISLFNNSTLRLRYSILHFITKYISILYLTNRIYAKNEIRDYIQKINKIFENILFDNLIDYFGFEDEKNIYSFIISYFHDYSTFKKEFKIIFLKKEFLNKSSIITFINSQNSLKDTLKNDLIKKLNKIPQNVNSLENYIFNILFPHLLSDENHNFIFGLNKDNTEEFIKRLNEDKYRKFFEEDDRLFKVI